MLPCQPPTEAKQLRWCEVPPFSFCGAWRQQEETQCCSSAQEEPGSAINKLKNQQTSNPILVQTEANKPNTVAHSSEPAPEPEAEPNSDEFDLISDNSQTNPTLDQMDEDRIMVENINSTETPDIFKDTEAEPETHLRPHRNLKNFKISVELSEENKVVFKVPQEGENDIDREINEVFNSEPEEGELFLEINEEKTGADVNSLTVKSLQELEALVIRKVKNILHSQQGSGSGTHSRKFK